jgi:xanthine dehydrogenase molybdenum-binding subunit
MFVVMDNGPYDPQGDANQSGRMVSLMYQPPAMRWRGVTVLTNTPPRVSQSQPGGFQGMRSWNRSCEGFAQTGYRSGGDPPDQYAGRQGAHRTSGQRASGLYVTSAFIKEALDMGVEQFEWEKRKAQPKRSGNKVRGIGVATSCFVGGSHRLRRAVRHQARWQALHPVGHRQSGHGIGAATRTV